MAFDILILLRYFIIVLYGTICFINIIFTLFIDKYQSLNEILEFELINSRPLTILESNIINIDEWLFAHHAIVGPILFLLSLFDACTLSNLIMRL